MILAIESSCDESAAALFDEDAGVVWEQAHSQVERHQPYGGIVPDLASREHLANFPALLEQIHKKLSGHIPDKVGVTRGPGLAGCLALGVALAKSLALAWRTPLAGVNHLRGHAFSPFIGFHRENPEMFFDRLEKLLPHLGLIVSGGNTMLFAIEKNSRRLRIIAESADDAAGEALDKGAKLLGMEYPGGPLIERATAGGDPAAFDFPRAYHESHEMKFSFSGLKTSLRYRLEKMSDASVEKAFPDLCASYQEAAVGALARKTEQALAQRCYASLGLSGGVANNRRLRRVFAEMAEQRGLPLFSAAPRHTGDNAAMIAFAAYADPEGCLNDDRHGLTIYPALALT